MFKKSSSENPSDLLTATSADLLKAPRLSLRLLHLVLVGLVATFIFWASQSHLEQATRAQGHVIPAGRVQLVQNLEGGIIEQIDVRDGDRVEAGEPLVRINTARVSSDLNEAAEKISGYRASLIRLEAEFSSVDPVFGDDFVAQHPEIVRDQRALFDARQRAREATLREQDTEIEQLTHEISEWVAREKNAEQRLVLALRELDIIKPLVRRGAAPKIELLTLERQLNEIEETISTAQATIPRLQAAIKQHEEIKAREVERARTEILAELNETRVSLAALEEATEGTRDQLKRAIVRAPVSGTVKSVNVNTLGQVVAPGVDIVEIIPAEDTLLIEGKVQPQDIAFLRPDLETNIRMTAYDFSIYGGLKGRLESISADSIEDDRGNRYYLVKVRADRNALEHNGETLPIIPGMTAEVNIVTGEKTVLDYLIKPVLKTVANSLHER